MAEEEIIAALRDFLSQEFPRKRAAIDRLVADDPLAELGVLDSMGMLTLAAFVEARWSVKIPARSFPSVFASLRSAAAAIASHRKTR